MFSDGPVLRLFEVRARKGCASKLIEKFSTTSAAVVRNEPGSMGYFFGSVIEQGGDSVVFASLWKDLTAVRDRFGEDWQASYLPPGYDELIAECSVRHLDLRSGWHIHGLS